MQIKVVTATYKKTGQDSQYPETGTVKVVFSNNRWAEFEKVDHLDFNNWAKSDFDPCLVPFDMAAAFKLLWNYFINIELRNLEDDLARQGLRLDDDGAIISEDDLEDEDEDEPEDDVEIRADDYLGQVTSIPSHGKGRIRDDDYLGQVTGIPTSGFEPDPDDET